MGDENTETFEDKVQATVEQLVTGEDGKLGLPEGVEASEAVLYTAKVEKRRRDTYSSLTKAKNENKTLTNENSALATQWEEEAVQNVTAEQRAELEELKASDPDAWLVQVGKYKDEAKTKFTEKREGITKTVAKETEVQRRARLVEEYNAANPKFILTDEVIANDVPPRIVNQLANGELTFEEFIEKSSKYLTATKVVGGGGSKEEEPNMSEEGGSPVPSKDAIESDIHESYKKTVF